METDPLSILVIDDSEADRDLLVTMLHKGFEERCKVFLATSAAEGYALMKEAHYDCILLDFVMPDMTGLEMLFSLQAQKSAVPIVIISGSKHIDKKALNAGAADSLDKNTLNAILLAKTIKNAIEKQKFINQLHEEQALTELFLAILSHDLRNHIQVIKGYAGMLFQEREHLPIHLWEPIAKIDKTIDFISRLADNTLAVCLLNRGKMSLATSEFDLVESIQSSISLFQHSAQEKKLSLQFTPPPQKSSFGLTAISSYKHLIISSSMQSNIPRRGVSQLPL